MEGTDRRGTAMRQRFGGVLYSSWVTRKLGTDSVGQRSGGLRRWITRWSHQARSRV